MKEIKGIKFSTLFIASLLLFIFFNNLRADEKTPARVSKELNIRYEEALNLYQQGHYLKAKEKIGRILATLNSDSYTESWRKNNNIKPSREDISQMTEKIETYIQQEKDRQQAISQELKIRKEEAKARYQEELIREKKQKEEQKQKRLAELKALQAELAKQKEERLKQQQELKAKQEQERKAKEAELAKQREERLRQQQELDAKREAERKAKEEVLAKQKVDKEKQQQELKTKQEQELASQRRKKQRQLAEEKAKQEQERKAKEEELKAQKQKETPEKQPKLEAERKTKEAEPKAQKQKETPEKQPKLEAERKTKEAEPKAQKQKETPEKQLKLETERKAREEELAQQRLKQQVELEAKRQEEQKAKQEELTREREKLELKVNEMKRASVQEKAMTEAMSKKHRQDQAKLKKIEELWVRARKLYEQGMYEEAAKGFEEIIKLEGNPRIKYTPSALEYIEKAKNNLIQKNRVILSKGVEQVEKEMMNEVLKRQVPPYIEPPQHIEQKEPVSLIEPPAIRKKLRDAKITMDFDKVGLKSVIAFLSQESGINFVASQKVLDLALVVSARFKETGLDEVIKYITKNLGLIYRIDKEVVWVAHPEEIANEPMETRVYYLTRGGGLFTEFSPVSSGTTETGLGGSSAQITKVYTIEDTLKEVVPWPSDAKISYDKRINALIVRNTPQNLQMLEDMLYSLDIEPLQVLIEARFLEVNITDTKELGLEWSIPTGDLRLKDRNGTFKAGLGQGTGVDFTAFTRAAEGLNLTYKGMLTNSQFQAVLHALEETQKIKTLSSPRITTLNNQLATMKVVDEWIYPTRYEYEIVQSDNNGDGDYNDAGETSYKNVPKDFLRRDVGILLKVIPSVGADKKTISLSLIPEVSEGTADGFTYTGGVSLPKFTSRNLSTTVIVNSGETVVLGGLIKESRTTTVTRVPVLGNIPLLGAFFRKNRDSIERKNLLIFVTAKVLSSSGEEVVIAQK